MVEKPFRADTKEERVLFSWFRVCKLVESCLTCIPDLLSVCWEGDNISEQPAGAEKLIHLLLLEHTATAWGKVTPFGQC